MGSKLNKATGSWFVAMPLSTWDIFYCVQKSRMWLKYNIPCKQIQLLNGKHMIQTKTNTIWKNVNRPDFNVSKLWQPYNGYVKEFNVAKQKL